MAALQAEASVRPTALDVLLGRRSVSPKRLVEPGPNSDELDLIVQAALRAPDHGALVPWRLIEFPPGTRALLAGLFEQEKLRRCPDADEQDLSRAREHALRSPTLLAFVISLKDDSQVPHHEQMLSAGAALGYLLQAAHSLGFGGIVLSGERCEDSELKRSLGLTESETLAGFISIGTAASAKTPNRNRAAPLTQWHSVCSE